MSTFGERLKSVPASAWVVGILFSIPVALALVLGPMRMDPEMKAWPVALRILLAAVIPAFVIPYAGLVGFIYADAKRRRMRHVLWAWLALVPYFVGVILYFILRDPLPTPCPTCRMDVPHTFAFCPGCGASIHPVCGQCGKSLQRGWLNCPHCGTRIAPPDVA
jgi:Double zinc ribbon